MRDAEYMQQLVGHLIRSANAFDVDGVLRLFATDAVIDDASIGDVFIGAEGIRRYFEQYFTGYKTVSRLLSIKSSDAFNADVHLDFMGDFGHEIGLLKISLDRGGMIEHMDADLQ